MRRFEHPWVYLLLLAVNAAQGQTLPPASNALQSMNAPSGAKASALGGAFSSIADDASALTWNPAGMAWVDQPEIQTTYNQWLMDTFFQDLQCVFPIGGVALGGRLSYVNFGSFDLRDSSGSIVGTLAPQAFSLSVGGSAKWGHLGLGLLVKAEMESYGANSLQGFGVDGGLLYRDNWGNLAAGMRNVGAANGVSLPVEFYAGGSKTFGDRSSSWTLSTDATFPQGPAVLHHGLEWGYDQVVFIRAGYQWATQIASQQDQAGFGGGVGVHFENFKVDYSMVSYGDLGLTNKVSLAYELGTPPVSAAKAVEKPVAVMVKPNPAPQVSNGTPAEPSGLGMKALYKKGIAAYKKGKYKAAVSYLKKAVATQDGTVEPFYYAEAYSILGVLFEYHAKYDGHMKTARGYYQKALEKEPTNGTALKHVNDGE